MFLTSWFLMFNRSKSFYNIVFLFITFSPCVLVGLMVASEQVSLSDFNTTYAMVSILIFLVAICGMLILLFFAQRRLQEDVFASKLMKQFLGVLLPFAFIMQPAAMLALFQFAYHQIHVAIDAANASALIPVAISCVPLFVALLVLATVINNTCTIHIDTVDATLLSSTSSQSSAVIGVFILIAIIIHPLPTAGIGTFTVTRCISGAFLIMAGFIAALLQQYTLMVSNIIQATVYSFTGVVLIVLPAFDAAPLSLLTLLVIPVIIVISLWPIAAYVYFYRTIAAVRASYTDGEDFGPTRHIPPVPRAPTFILLVGLRTFIRAVSRAVTKEMKEANLDHCPVALPGFVGSDQFETTAASTRTTACVRAVDSSPTVRSLFKVFQLLMAAKPHSSAVVLQYGVVANSLQPTSLPFVLRKIAELQHGGHVPMARLDVGYVIFYLYKTNADACEGGKEARLRHARNRQLQELRRQLADFRTARRTLWTTIQAQSGRSLKMASVTKSLALMQEILALTTTMQANYRKHLVAATPNVIREYAAYVNTALGKSAEAQHLLGLAEDMEASGKGRSTVVVEPVKSIRLRRRRFMVNKAELRSVVTIVLVALITIGMLFLFGASSYLIINRATHLLHGSGNVASAIWAAFFSAEQFIAGLSPVSIVGPALCDRILLAELTYSASPTAIANRIAQNKLADSFRTDLAGSNLELLLNMEAFVNNMSWVPDVQFDLLTADRVSHFIITLLTSYLDDAALEVVTDYGGVTYASFNTTAASFIDHFFFRVYHIADQGMSAAVLNPSSTALNMSSYDDIMMMESPVFISQYADQAYESYKAIHDAIYDMAVEAPIIAMFQAIAILVFFTIGLFVSVFGCFMLTMGRDISSFLAHVKLIYDLPPAVTTSMIGSRGNGSHGSTGTPVAQTKLADDELSDEDDIVDAETLQRIRMQPSVDNSDETETDDDPSCVLGKSSRAAYFKLVFDVMLQVIPLSLCWQFVLPVIVCLCLVVDTGLVLFAGVKSNDVYVLYEIDRRAISMTAHIYQMIRLEEESGAYNQEIRAAIAADIVELRAGLSFVTSSSTSVREWLPSLSSSHSTLSALFDATRTLELDLLDSSWASGLHENELSSIISDTACRLDASAINACPTSLGGLDSEIEAVITEGLGSALEYLTMQAAQLVIDTHGAYNYSTVENLKKAVWVGIHPYLRDCLELIMDEQALLLSYSMYANGATVAVIVVLLLAMHWTLNHRSLLRLEKAHNAVLFQLQHVNDAFSVLLPPKTARAIRAILPKDADEWVDE
ncbi:hypothetical protein J8273_6502 [Carpediemonas membranifera]|uniref:Transmembrane protein n=1 Tax=Carpediemonas membranifera TaxID=201153 RepID=A0A8J6AQP4_9EUKA|nr:hypothetical protein J8273_6502 [Carpediemonas membranifera]|eukprot:KAG9391726.1 hypothetical protein J8273_6502 [Carpediemonas membranifera]